MTQNLYQDMTPEPFPDLFVAGNTEVGRSESAGSRGFRWICGYLLVFCLLSGCQSLDVPSPYKSLKIKGIDKVSCIGFDRNPDVSDTEFRNQLTALCNETLEDYGVNTGDPNALQVTLTNVNFVFEAQRFTLNQFNPFSRDAYLFAKDVEFGVLFRFRVDQGDQELVTETNFVHVYDRLYYFERSTPWLWIITGTIFPYYEYYQYSAEYVAESMVIRMLDKLLNQALPEAQGRKAFKSSGTDEDSDQQGRSES